jgi:hypothetical protein
MDSGDEFGEDFVAIVEMRHYDKIRELVFKYHFDLVQYSVGLTIPNDFPNLINHFKKVGTKIVLDVDDLYMKRPDVAKAIKACDALTTTSENLQRHYGNYYNKWGYIIENGIDPKEDQWKIYPVKNEEPVFGYLGSTRHEDDLRVMEYDFSTRPLFVVCEEYRNLLNVSHHSLLKTWNEYAWEYNCIDVALAPLVPNKFNQSKSFLKVVESGFKKKAIIVSDTEPYNRHPEFYPVIDRIKVGESWKERIESYTMEEATQRGEELFKLVQPWDVRNLNKRRREIYTEILNK